MWTPNLQEQVYGEIEPHNPVDKYAVAVKKDEEVVGHLPLGENGKFAKTIFYFLCADPYGKCNITVTGKAVNLGLFNELTLLYQFCVFQLPFNSRHLGSSFLNSKQNLYTL